MSAGRVRGIRTVRSAAACFWVNGDLGKMNDPLWRPIAKDVKRKDSCPQSHVAAPLSLLDLQVPL